MKHTALITGASRGIGAAIAMRFAEAGYNLSLCCHNSANDLKELADNLRRKYKIEVLTFIGDVSDFAFVSEMTAQTKQRFNKIEVLVNNAGVSYIGLIHEMTVEEWNHVLSVNLNAAFFTAKCIIPDMISCKQGKIINISSVWGNIGASCEAAYSASKGGLNAFTKALGKELAPSNIQVNAIACGVIDTAMNHCFSEEERRELADEIPAGRFGKAEEAAELAYFLATGSEYLNGQILTLDGGWI